MSISTKSCEQCSHPNTTPPPGPCHPWQGQVPLICLNQLLSMSHVSYPGVFKLAITCPFYQVFPLASHIPMPNNLLHFKLIIAFNLYSIFNCNLTNNRFELRDMKYIMNFPIRRKFQFISNITHTLQNTIWPSPQGS